MPSLDNAISSVDKLASRLEQGLSAGVTPLPLRVDPDDPWADAINPPAGVYKASGLWLSIRGARVTRASQERCPITGYLRTLPFESQCPLPGAFKADNSWLDGMLAPVIKPKGSVANAGAHSSKAPEAVGARAAAAKASKADKAAAKSSEAAAAAAPAAAEAAAAAPGTPAAAPAVAAPPSVAEAAEAFAKAKLVVGKVVSAGFVEGSDKLYLCSVDVGEDKPRQVITGLRKYVAQEQLSGASCVVILNLKPAKLAGHASEAMILAAEALGVEPDDRRVFLLVPPAGAAPGTRVLAATAPAAAPPKECKSAAWALIKTLLRVVDGKASFAGEPLRTEHGPVTIGGPAPDGAAIQ